MSGVTLDKIVKRYGPPWQLTMFHLISKKESFLLSSALRLWQNNYFAFDIRFIQPTSGAIHFGEKDVTGIAPQHRQIGMVFQDYALFPHLTVSENISFGLVERKYEKHAIKERVDELLALIKLENAAERYPSEISGGQAQRVAVARAVAHPPSVLLMDEP